MGESVTADYSKEMNAWRKAEKEELEQVMEFEQNIKEFNRTQDVKFLKRAKLLQKGVLNTIVHAQTKLATFNKVFAKFRKDNAKRIKADGHQAFFDRIADMAKEHGKFMEGDAREVKNFPFPKDLKPL
jgi:hypothetical protein